MSYLVATSQVTKSRKRASKSPRLREVVKGQGRSLVWLSRVTGYSVRQISRVAAGEHPGTQRFHIAMRAALGDEYVA